MSLSGSYGWTDTLKTVYYGPGCAATALPKLIQALGVKKGLIVTGRSLYTKTDVVAKIEEILKAHDAYAGVFTNIGEHTPVAGINECIKVFQDSGADFIVAVGGGSPIDGSKAIRYRIQEQTGAAAPPLQIAIPTTLSAAEYSTGAGYTDENGIKTGVVNDLLAPAGVILDAELTLPTPSRLWLSTGIRALDHSVESLYRPLVSPPGKIMCYAALADLFKYLPISKADPTNIEARQKLLIAAWMSLWPTKWDTYGAIGLSHAIGHGLGATYSIPHGITSCLTLAPVVALQTRMASPEDKECLANALFYLREPSTGSIDGDILKLSSLIAGLVENLGLKSTLGEYNVPREDLPKLCQGREPIVQLLNGLY
ncbi:iron-containing alcohol dehydrogenase [Mycena maculata]|uniref:Iron-containing alcohol dehydrogenase n=1 Tax=Mycena maculata TaxID=230809 RepID=A0AAD7JQJ6_9AGAR|nr:iron-containing alcohol dehydrogenase [Mycena maculata]